VVISMVKDNIIIGDIVKSDNYYMHITGKVVDRKDIMQPMGKVISILLVECGDGRKEWLNIKYLVKYGGIV
jgi:hypothetical protein